MTGDGVAPVSSGDLVVSVEGAEAISPLGKHGEFYFESLPPGHHPARVRGSDQPCELTLSIPRSDEPFVNVGAAACAPGDVPSDSAPAR